MFANNEVTERRRLQRLLDRDASHGVALEERTLWAHTIEGAIKDAAGAAFPARNRIARPVVVLSAASALSAVAAALRDEDVGITPETLAAVRSFMTDGIDSPLYGGDPLAARRDAEALRRRVAGAGIAARTAATVA
jgi:hypothetical protein